MEELFNVYPILREINVQNNGVIEKTAVRRTVSYGESMERYGDRCMGFSFIVSGEMKVIRLNNDGKETLLYKLKKGEICHEAMSCILNCKGLNIVGEIVQDTVLYVIPLDIVKKYFITNNNFMKYIYMNLYKKINTIIDGKEEVLHDSIEKRIMDYLEGRKSRIIYITHSDLALEIGSAREVVSRKLKELEKRGRVKLDRGKIQLL